jgi:hypothetical protein
MNTKCNLINKLTQTMHLHCIQRCYKCSIATYVLKIYCSVETASVQLICQGESLFEHE